MKRGSAPFGAGLWTCLLAALSSPAFATGIQAVLDGKSLPEATTVLVREGQSIVLKADAPRSTDLRWYRLIPLQKPYEIQYPFPGGRPRPVEVEYALSEIRQVRGRAELSWGEGLGVPGVGTWYFLAWSGDEPPASRRVFSSGLPQGPGGAPVVQLVVRKDDTYMGYLSELMNVPFGLPPLPVKGRNQTDLRVLTDCAEFALYGKRRQGRPFHYVGPGKIGGYLTAVHEGLLTPRQVDGRWVYCEPGTKTPFSLRAHGITPGDVLYFGDQVGVLYEERGEPDVLNPEDLMFYSYNQPPRILPIGRTEFQGRPLRVYRWK